MSARLSESFKRLLLQVCCLVENFVDTSFGIIQTITAASLLLVENFVDTSSRIIQTKVMFRRRRKCHTETRYVEGGGGEAAGWETFMGRGGWACE